MKLRDIGFSFGFGNWMADGQVCHQSLLSKSWSLLIFVQQALTKAKFENDQINSIWFRPIQNCASLEPTNRGGNLYVDVRIDWDHFAGLNDPDKINALLCDLFEQGLSNIPESFNAPVDFLRDTVAAFREGGFINEWIFVTRSFRAKKAKAQLNCALDTEQFKLTLVVWQDGKEVFNDVILKTFTDPLYFHDAFKDIKCIDGEIVVLRRHPKLIDGVPLDAPLFQWKLPE
ncbi:MAG: hypothetical protein ACSHXB_16275 [Sulfitobacter sp.]